MGVNKGDQGRLENVTRLIQQKSRAGKWRVTTERLGELLGLDTVDLYRTLYADPRGVTFSEAIDGFNEERVGELVTFLEALGFTEAEDRFYRAGLFVPLEAGNRLTETFLSRYARALARHTADWEEVDHYFLRGDRYGEVARRYLEAELPAAPLIEESAALFRERRGLPEIAFYALVRYLQMLQERRVLEYPVFAAPFYEQVYRFGVRKGYILSRERYFGAGTGARGAGSAEDQGSGQDRGEMVWAREQLGLSEGASLSDVRRAYRRRMLRFHPDVNPRGTEVAKELNRAYATLLGGIEGSPGVSRRSR